MFCIFRLHLFPILHVISLLHQDMICIVSCILFHPLRIHVVFRLALLILVGMDFVEERVVEINVFSPGGLWHSEQLAGAAFSDSVIAAIEQHFLDIQ